MFRRRRRIPPDEILVRPRCETERDSEGHIVLLKPRFGWGPLKRLLLPRLRSPYVRITLDEIGTFAWEQMDGRRTVGEIALLLAERFKDATTGIALPNAQGRLWQFVVQLHRHGLVELSAPDHALRDRDPGREERPERNGTS